MWKRSIRNIVSQANTDTSNFYNHSSTQDTPMSSISGPEPNAKSKIGHSLNAKHCSTLLTPSVSAAHYSILEIVNERKICGYFRAYSQCKQNIGFDIDLGQNVLHGIDSEEGFTETQQLSETKIEIKSNVNGNDAEIGINPAAAVDVDLWNFCPYECPDIRNILMFIGLIIIIWLIIKL